MESNGPRVIQLEGLCLKTSLLMSVPRRSVKPLPRVVRGAEALAPKGIDLFYLALIRWRLSGTCVDLGG